MGDWWNAFAARAERRGEDLGRVADVTGEQSSPTDRADAQDLPKTGSAGTQDLSLQLNPADAHDLSSQALLRRTCRMASRDGIDLGMYGGAGFATAQLSDNEPKRPTSDVVVPESHPFSSADESKRPIPKVEVAKYAGACFGVQRALDLLEGVLDGSEGTVRTLGPLIHNPRVVGELEGRGVEVVDEVPDDEGSTLVLRTHGVTPDVEDAAAAAGLEVVDATCPYVHTAQSKAEGLARDGYQVIVFGERGHPEVEGILARAEGAIAVGDVGEALAAGQEALDAGKPLGLLAQTTQNEERFEAIADALRELTGGELEVRKTICHATRQRQEAAEELADRADVMVVIGGRNSANTTRLAELCAERCETHHVENPEELDPRWFEGRPLVGVTAGASTPQSQIDEVVDAIGGTVGTG